MKTCLLLEKVIRETLLKLKVINPRLTYFLKSNTDSHEVDSKGTLVLSYYCKRLRTLYTKILNILLGQQEPLEKSVVSYGSTGTFVVGPWEVSQYLANFVIIILEAKTGSLARGKSQKMEDWEFGMAVTVSASLDIRLAFLLRLKESEWSPLR